MKNMHQKRHGGSLLLEGILAIALFAIFLGGVGLVLIEGEQSTVASGNRLRATVLADRQLSALRAIRDDGFSSLTAGTHGVAINSSGRWVLNSSGSTTTSDGYQLTLTLTSRGTNIWEATSRATWNFNPHESGSITVTTYLSNWQAVTNPGNWHSVLLTGSNTPGGTPDFHNIAVSGNYAFVTSDHAAGGKGLYMFDITNPASPTRINSTFDLGASGYGIVADGYKLFIATDNASNEVMVFDTRSPSTMSPGVLSGSYNIAGSVTARSIAVYGSTLYVGTNEQVSGDELLTLTISPGSLAFEDSLNMTGDVRSIALHDGYAYTATSDDPGELKVVDVFDPTDLSFVTGIGIDLTDVYDGLSVITTETGVIIGRVYGSSIMTINGYSIEDSALPSSPPGPWTFDAVGDVNGLAMDPAGTYLFVGDTATNAQVRILDLPILMRGGSPSLVSYNAGGNVNGLYYDWSRDKLFIVTPTQLRILSPGS
jgi:hypothetical protein